MKEVGFYRPSPRVGANRVLAASHLPQGYRLTWADEFDDLSLNDDPENQARWASMFIKWNVRHLAGNNDEGVKVSDTMTVASGRQAGEALRSTGRWGDKKRYLHEVSDGTLKLRAYPLEEKMRKEFWGFPYVASMVESSQAFAQRYGYWEIVARINAIGKGHHLAFWLLGDDGSWPPEMDILEVVGPKPDEFTSNTHLPEKGKAPPMSFYPKPTSANGFNTFGFEWTPTVMRWTVDGEVVREHGNFINDKSLYLLMSWELGSNWPGDPDESTPWPAEVEIDYVRVYHKVP